MGKAFSCASRLEMVEMLAQCERSVEDLARVTNLSVANASRHLQVLKSAGLVSARRLGNQSIYRLSSSDVESLWISMRQVGERHLAEVHSITAARLGHRDSAEAVTLEELRRRVELGDVIALDVRPCEEYAAGHIPGAVNIPMETLDAMAQSLPKDRTIVAYCRGPYCLLSDDAVAWLNANGYRALRCEMGFPEWRAKGFTVESAMAA